MEKQDFFKVGSRENPVISNSSLSYINPLQGGSPQAFLDFFVDKNEAEKSYYRMGHLIHKWVEDREAFLISAVNKPSDKLGDVAECAIAIAKDEKIKWETEVTQVMPYKPEYDSIILEACKVVAWNRTWGDAALIKNAVPAVKPYMEEVLKAEDSNKIYVTLKESEVIDCCVKSVEKHPLAKELLFMQDTDFSNKKVYKELEIYWNKLFIHSPGQYEKDITLYFKAKLDSLVIDFDKKIVTYTDPKTTSKSAYSFGDSFINYHYYILESKCE